MTISNSQSASYMFSTVSNHNTIGSINRNDHDDVYGFYNCQGDITGSFCQFCIHTAVREIAQRCLNSVSAMICLIGKLTTKDNSNWATGEYNWTDTEKRYALVQCNRVLSKDGCRQCLKAMLDRVPQCCRTKVTWVVVSHSCAMTIDDCKFYQLQTGSPSPMSNP
ncbi:cysteine-rich receptor-like protein kinase, partial [Trifolium medium]|nr:cysteine-rich receptor-like protein kinase [Trifolium medium]